MREFSPLSSNWRADETAQHFLTNSGVPVISGIDTRALVRHLRSRGVMRGVLVRQLGATATGTGRTRPQVSVDDRAGSRHARVHSTISTNGTSGVDPLLAFRDSAMPPPKRAFTWSLTISESSATSCADLVQTGCRVTVVPAGTTAEDVLALKPNGVFLSNGPGDPEPLTHQAEQVRKLIGKMPIFGICLGHQILGLALGGKTYKLKFGHRGANHPVLNKVTGQVEITSHNHGFAVDPDSLNLNEIEITHMNLNDETLEGFRHRNHPVFCVQYHPEAAPGPHDSHYLFDDFVKLMEAGKLDAAPQRHPPHPDRRLGPDHHRPGLRVRLFRRAGLQGAAADGYEVVLINSNPATIMTDPNLADRTYVEPLSVEYAEEVIRRERPDALLSTVGGQTGLNLVGRAGRSRRARSSTAWN